VQLYFLMEENHPDMRRRIREEFIATTLANMTAATTALGHLYAHRQVAGCHGRPTFAAIDLDALVKWVPELSDLYIGWYPNSRFLPLVRSSEPNGNPAAAPSVVVVWPVDQTEHAEHRTRRSLNILSNYINEFIKVQSMK
jgi:hypothetical protein